VFDAQDFTETRSEGRLAGGSGPAANERFSMNEGLREMQAAERSVGTDSLLRDDLEPRSRV
jgi:hypothetical protein